MELIVSLCGQFFFWNVTKSYSCVSPSFGTYVYSSQIHPIMKPVNIYLILRAKNKRWKWWDKCLILTLKINLPAYSISPRIFPIISCVRWAQYRQWLGICATPNPKLKWKWNGSSNKFRGVSTASWLIPRRELKVNNTFIIIRICYKHMSGYSNKYLMQGFDIRIICEI